MLEGAGDYIGVGGSVVVWMVMAGCVSCARGCRGLYCCGRECCGMEVMAGCVSFAR